MPTNTTGVAAIETERQLTVTANVAGAEPLKLEYGKARFDPQVIEITVSQEVGQPWKPRRLEVSGPNVKADGSIGANPHENSYSYWEFNGRQSWSGTPPQWLLDLLAEQLDALNGGGGS